MRHCASSSKQCIMRSHLLRETQRFYCSFLKSILLVGFTILIPRSAYAQKPASCTDPTGNCCVDTNDNSCTYPSQMFNLIKGQGNLFDFADGETMNIYIKVSGNAVCGNILLEPKTGDNCYYDERITGPQCLENCGQSQSCSLIEIGHWDDTACSGFTSCGLLATSWTIGSNSIVFHGYENSGSESYWYYEITSGTSPSISHVTFGMICPNGTIGNYVWGDEDNDGIQDVDEDGIDGITVKLYDDQNTLLETQSTDSNGEYLFTDLFAGDYHVEFEYPNTYEVSIQDAGGDDTKDSDIMDSGQPQKATTGTLTLESSEDDITIDAGLNFASLPVRFGNFTVAQVRNHIELNWSTYSEVNNQGFYIEKAVDDPDNFESIGYVEGSGFSNEKKYYSYTDLNLGRSNSNFYYRLRQVDFDGSESFSAIRSLSLDGASQLEVFPNPTTGIVSVYLPNRENSKRIRVYNAVGQKVHDLNLQSGSSYYQMDLSDLENGVFLIHIENGTESEIKKIIVEK